MWLLIVSKQCSEEDKEQEHWSLHGAAGKDQRGQHGPGGGQAEGLLHRHDPLRLLARPNCSAKTKTFRAAERTAWAHREPLEQTLWTKGVFTTTQVHCLSALYVLQTYTADH